MSNLALYRKYRPTNFDEVYGQSAIVQTLRNQVKSGRIGHAYIFHGLRGSGKTSIARIFAKAVNCEHTVNGNPCGQCEHCNFQNDVNPDLIEIDAASNNGVDSIRQLIDEVNYKPINTKYKIYIIDEVHMLTNSAFNSLLKTIEEPPEHAIFILATTDYYKVPDTIKSRCQTYIFKRLTIDEIVSNLKNILSKENITYFDNEGLEFIARKADGSMRDALSTLDQCISNHEFSVNSNELMSIKELKQIFGDIDNDVIESLANAIESNNIVEGLDIIKEQYYEGRSLSNMLGSLYQYYFNSFTQDFGSQQGIIYERYARILGETQDNLKNASQPLIIVEVMFIKLCKPEMEKDYNSVVQRMNNLEQQLLSLQNGTQICTNINKEIDNNSLIYYNSTCSDSIIIL